MLQLGFGFQFHDLHRPEGLARLYERFQTSLAEADPELASTFDRYAQARRAGTPKGGLTGPAESDLLVKVAHEVSRFLAILFGLEAQVGTLSARLKGEGALFEVRREFVARRVFKKGLTDRPAAQELPELDRRMGLLLRVGFNASLPGFAPPGEDVERALVEAILLLMNVERGTSDGMEALKERLLADAEAKAVFGSSLVGDAASQARGLLALCDRWTYARAKYTHTLSGFSTFQLPKPVDFDALVPLQRPEPEVPELFEGLPEHHRRRDGFQLTDPRATPRQAMGDLDTCIICHEREKDSCSKGFIERGSVPPRYKPNPLGIPLTGCPLEEHISEMHLAKQRGDSLAALALITIANPMCAGTGHRICNDCMKACIFQKQEPVNIPQIETSVLTDVLGLPYGVELYGLLTRWNPLNVLRPYALPPNGKKVLIVGLGPAGYTLAHELLNEGFTVVGIDGLKLEPLDPALVGPSARPVEHWEALAGSVETRVLEGFGGVSEYGITVRWDKRFLSLIHLLLRRREGFRAYGGVRFGGTIDLDDAWALGFDHVSIAAGAGKPTLVPMKNNLARGVRAASDFLMGLQLTGAFKKDSLANMQVELPALVIGGGLTGVDTATELMAYYPVQVEKVLARHEALVQAGEDDALLATLRPAERATYETFLAHGRAVRAERERAAAAQEVPDFARLVRQWGGVALCYRRSLQDAPAYRLNHEEVTKALEEGIRFIENVSPVECVVDEHGQVSALRFERMKQVDGKLVGTGEHLSLPAKTVCVAAGTSPNVTYEHEHPGTFELDARRSFFRAHRFVEGQLVPTVADETGFFTSYWRNQRAVTFFGDNHPAYAGNVVKAMASARDGYAEISRLFEPEVKAQRAEDAPRREAERAAFFTALDDALVARVHAVNRLTPTIVEVVVRAPLAAKKFEPGQFYRLQNFERLAPKVGDATLVMEGLAATGAWVDKERGLLSAVILEMGASSRLCAYLKVGEPVVLMGPTGTPTEIGPKETVLLIGGGLGNAVLFSIGEALRAAGSQVLYVAGYRRQADIYKMDELEAAADQVIWATDQGPRVEPRRTADSAFVGNVVQALVAYGEGKLGGGISLADVNRVIAIGSDGMMRAVKEARHGVLAPFLKKGHHAIGSINSPMQCMMKEICAQCLQRHVDPRTGAETFVFSCFNQDQPLDAVDFRHLDMRLRGNSVLEKLTDAYVRQLLARPDAPPRTA